MPAQSGVTLLMVVEVRANKLSRKQISDGKHQTVGAVSDTPLISCHILLDDKQKLFLLFLWNEMRWDQVRKGKSVNNQCKYFEIQANSTLLLSSTILVTSAMYFTPSMARISSGQRPESSWSSSCRNKKIRWDGILQLSYPFYLCVWTEAWCKVDYPTAVEVAMQPAAWLVIRLVDSAEPIPPELSPAVPVVRPMVVLAAQVTIVITATVLSCISEIFWKNIQIKKISWFGM